MVAYASMAGPPLTMAWLHDGCDAASTIGRCSPCLRRPVKNCCGRLARLGWVCAALITVVLAFELVFLAATPVDVLVTKWGSPTDLVGLRWADDALAISLSAVAGAIGGIFDWLVTEIPKAITWPIVALIALFAILRSRRALAWLLPVFGRFSR
jgi:hypothetical protein